MLVTADEVRKIFEGLALGSSESFFDHVSEDVDWTVMGTHPLAGRYHTKQSFRASTFDRLETLMRGNMRLIVEHILVDGNWAVVELRSEATTKAGKAFDNRYCWVMRFENGLVTQVRAYLDSALVRDVVEAH
jgi:ketosteroid isomerase-like protein